MKSLILVLSIFIHASLLFFLPTEDKDSESSDKSKQKPGSVKINIVDKPTDKEIKADHKSTPLPENKSKVVVKKKKKAQEKQAYIDHKCEKWYSGIGVMNNGDGSCLITYVGKGYPADRAGIKPGDLVLKSDLECPGRGPLGTHILVKIMRGTQVLTFDLVREKICQKDM